MDEKEVIEETEITENDSFPNVLSIEMAAKYLTISRCYLYALVKGSFIPYTKIGKRIVFRKGDLYKWLGMNVVQPKRFLGNEEEYELEG